MGLARASAMIAAGTLASRVSGLARTMVLVAAVGSVGRAGDAFGTANQLPNSIYQVISAGILTGVIVPQVVRVSAQRDGGHAFLRKLLTLGATLMAVITIAATLAAPFFVDLFASNYTGPQRALATSFAYWCIPQLFFYGMFALLGEILNARKVFGPYAWAPVVNNVVSIAGFAAFIVIFGGDRTEVSAWTTPMIVTLAGFATLGIVGQLVVLIAFWRRVGIPMRPDFRWRGMGLGAMRNLASWTLVTTLIGQLVGIVQQRTMSDASGDFPSVFASQNAWLVYMVPYSVLILAIGTPYFTRLSEHAALGRHDELRADISQSIRTLGFFVIAATAAVAAAAVPASRMFSNNAESAVLIAPVLIGYLVSLIPMAVLYIVQRTFYAYGDARTPFVFTVVQGALVLVFTLLIAAFAPQEHITSLVALAQSTAGIAQTVLATALLRRKIGPLGLGPTWLALVRFGVIAAVAGAAGWGTYLLLGSSDGWMLANRFTGAAGAVIVAGVVGAVYVALLALMRAPEVRSALKMLRR